VGPNKFQSLRSDSARFIRDNRHWEIDVIVSGNGQGGSDLKQKLADKGRVQLRYRKSTNENGQSPGLA
jgi:hypothetical protein